MKRALRIVTIVVLILGLGTGGYTIFLYQSVTNTLNAIYEPLQPIHAAASPSVTGAVLAAVKPITGTAEAASLETTIDPDELTSNPVQEVKPVNLDNKESFTVLFMGVDERKDDQGRTDTIMVLGVNPAKHSILMFNIPRDTRTEIVGRGTMDKINHAYAFGGINMAVDTVENFLNIPINYYVKVNMEGFAKIIDIIGGAQVDNPFEFTYEGVTYPKGTISLDGQHALMYSRMRYDDPHGDLGRNARQQSILTNVFERAKRVSTVSKFTDILAQVKENTKTNLTIDNMLDIYGKYKDQIETISKDEIAGSNGTMDQIYYYMVSDSERDRMHQKLLEQLQ